MGSNPTLPNVQGTSLVDRINVAIHLRRYLKLIGRRWWILILSLLGFTGYYVKKAQDTPNVYRATSQLGFALFVENPEDRTVKVVDPRDGYYANQIQIMKSVAIRGRVAEAVRNYKPASGVALSPPIMSADQLLGSSNFELSVEANDFEYARLYASNWVHAYVNYKTEMASEALEKKTATTRQDLDRYQRLAERAREALLKFREENLIASAQDAGRAAEDELNRLNDEYRARSTARKRMESYTKDELANGPLADSNTASNRGKNPGASNNENASLTDPLAPFRDSNYPELKLQLKSKELRLEELAKAIKPKHPVWIGLEEEVRELKQKIKLTLDAVEEKRLASVKELLYLEESLPPLIAKAQEKVFTRAQTNHKYSRMVEEEAIAKGQVDKARSQLQTIEATPTNEERFNIIDAGIGDPRPISPDRPKMYLTGLLIGLVVGLGFIYLLHRLDDRLDLAEDIEAELGEPVLGQVPQMAASATGGERLLITKLDQHNMFAESIRGVRSAVLFGAQGNPRKVMLVSSAVPGDGKTTFTVNFAATLATSGQKVLLVDADLRRGNIHSYFAKDREPGLAEVLQGELHWGDVTQETEISNLHIINTGKLPSNPGELLMSQVARDFIQEARREYDYVLFDCPPLTAIDDTFCLLSYADGLLFVIKAGQTSMRFAKNALSAVKQRGSEILGLILNGITADNPYYYYNYYYHAYYSSEQAKVAGGSSTQPARKMASRRRRNLNNTSVATTTAPEGTALAPVDMAAEEQRKAQESKNRRSAQTDSRSANDDSPAPKG